MAYSPFLRFIAFVAWAWRRAVVVAGLLLASMLPLWAHDPGLSTAEIRLGPATLDARVSFSASDAKLLWTGLQPNGGDVPGATDPRWQVVAANWWKVRCGDAAVAPKTVSVAPTPDGGVAFAATYPRTGGVWTFAARQLGALPSQHREFALVADEHGQTVAEAFLTAAEPSLRATIPGNGEKVVTSTSRAARADAWGFFRLGVEHIWTGYDHLLFLFGLLVVCRSFRSVASIISCFTLAHSLTLAAATLNLVHLPSRWVESAIAVSIAFVGLENLWRRGNEPRGRWVLTFAFGLIHGFGFASALRDLGVGDGFGGVVLPLVSFNVGVEAGQMAVAALALPIVWRLRRRENFLAYGVPALSAFVAAAGVFWFVERAFAI